MRSGAALAAALSLAAALTAAATPAGAERRGDVTLRETEAFVPVAGGKLRVVTIEPAGKPSGATLLLLHGASGNLGDLRESIARKLAERRRVILIDRPGHGGSDRLGGREMASPGRQADAVVQALDAMRVGRVVVVGHSWSGALATNLALDHPSRVSGLALLAPATHPWPGPPSWYNRAAATPILGSIFAVAVAAPVGSVVFDRSVASVFAPRPMPPDYVDRTDAKLLLRPAEFSANAEDLVDLKSFVAAQAPRYGAIRVPTVIVTSDKDDTVSPQIHARPLARQIKGARIVWLKDAGHMPHWTETARTVREIEAVAARTER